MRLEDIDFNNGEKRKLKALTHDMCLDLLDEKYDEKVEIILKKYSKPGPKKKSILDDFFKDIASKMEENIGKWQEEMASEEEEYYESEQALNSSSCATKKAAKSANMDNDRLGKSVT